MKNTFKQQQQQKPNYISAKLVADKWFLILSVARSEQKQKMSDNCYQSLESGFRTNSFS